MSEKILTISVAAYNLENLISENLESFIKCKERESLEVLVIDDGSKDNTANIAKEYEDKYPETIRLIKKKNEGAGSTVNYGIKNATGKYFKMIDGDDWVKSEELDNLINELKNIDVDMVITNYITYNEATKQIIDKTNYNVESGKKVSLLEISKNNNVQMHNVLYKTEILKDNNIVLDNGFYTDMEYLLLPIPYVNDIIYYNFDIYMYRVAREGQSVSLSSMQKHIDMHRLVLDRLLKYYGEKAEGLDNDKSGYMLKKISDMADTQLSTLLTFEINEEQKKKIKDFVEFIKEYEKVYDIFKNGKKEKILLKSNFILTKFASKMVLKRLYNN